MRGRLGRRHGAGAEADPAGGLAGSGEQALGCSAMRQFLEAVMFDRPHVVEPDFIGELNLGHHLPVLVVLIVLVPRLGYLDFVHQAELHRCLLASWRCRHGTAAETNPRWPPASCTLLSQESDPRFADAARL